MLLVVKDDSAWEELSPLLKYCQEFNVDVQERYGATLRMLMLLGDTSKMDICKLLSFDVVEKIHRLQEPHTLARRKNHPEDTVIDLGGTLIGGGNFLMAAGPRSVESEEQIFACAREVKAAGANLLRGGGFMTRSFPYSFEGLRDEGIRLLCEAGKAVGLPVMTEIIESAQVPLFENVDVIQIGTRNMQNYELFRELGQINKPLVIKRDPGCNVQELLQSAEYAMSCGNSKLILCSSGIRTFENITRYTMDIGSLVELKAVSHLPLMVDPSQAAGRRKYVKAMALAAAAAGVDGMMLEVHPNPHDALSDAHLSLTPEGFNELYGHIKAVREAAVK